MASGWGYFHCIVESGWVGGRDEFRPYEVEMFEEKENI